MKWADSRIECPQCGACNRGGQTDIEVLDEATADEPYNEFFCHRCSHCWTEEE